MPEQYTSRPGDRRGPPTADGLDAVAVDESGGFSATGRYFTAAADAKVLTLTGLDRFLLAYRY